MGIQCKWVTSVTAGVFSLSAVTGVLIFFNFDSGANKPVHEWPGLLLITAAILLGTVLTTVN
jgi:hypothetical protein